MKLRLLKNKLFSKSTLYYIVFALLIYNSIFILIKSELFYWGINYSSNYLSYYTSNYLNNNINNLIFNDMPYFFIESDVVNIYSAVYIYVVSFSSMLFNIFMFIAPLLLFVMIQRKIYEDIYNKNMYNHINRIGKKKFVSNTLFVYSFYSGLMIIIPKMLFFLELSIFFPNTVSSVHFITDASFLSQSFLYVGYKVHPYLLILIDLCVNFIFGVSVALISIIISSMYKNKIFSYITIILFYAITSIFTIKAPFLYLHSIFNFFDFYVTDPYSLKLYDPLLIGCIYMLVSFIIARIVLRKKIERNV